MTYLDSAPTCCTREHLFFNRHSFQIPPIIPHFICAPALIPSQVMVSRVPGSSGQSSRFPPLLQKLTVQVYNPIICPASSSTPVKRGSDCSTWYPHQHANGGSSMVLSCGTAHWSSSFRLQHAFIDHMGKCELTSVYPSTKVALAGGIFQVLPLNTCRVLQSTVWLFFFFFLIESAHLAYTRHVSVSP